MFKGSAHRWIAALALLSATATPLTSAGGAERGDTAPAARAAYTPVSGAYFNNAIGTEAEQNRIIDRMVRMTNAAPAESVIRINTLNLEMDGPTDALVAAHERGVHVRIVMTTRSRPGPHVDRLTATLGSDPSAPSYLVKCANGCLSPSVSSNMHTKMWLFDAVGDASQVLTVTTANLTVGQTRAWNDAVTVVGNRPLYAAAVEYFDTMAFDQPTTDFTTIATAPRYRLFLFPGRQKQGVADYFTTSLARIDCRGVPRKARAGKDGRTVVRFRSTIWRDNRTDVAERLVALHRAGCNVRATINLELTDPQIKRVLFKGGVVTRYQSRAAADIVSHGKTILVSGVQRRQVINTVHTGSTNPSRLAERRNDNAMVQVRNDRRITDKFLGNFVAVWKHSRALTKKELVEARPIPARVRG